jgi:hypothetical protein
MTMALAAIERNAAIRKLVPSREALFAVLDGASVPKLPTRLKEDGVQAVNLLSDKPAPDIALTGPWLVTMTQKTFADWVIANWGQHWGVLVTSAMPFEELVPHFRSLVQARLPDGRTVFFRFYDPRVLRVLLPTCDADQLQQIFGAASQFVMEDEAGGVLRFGRGKPPLMGEVL